MAFLSADYSNSEQLVFCDAAGVPGQFVTPCELEGVASIQGDDLVEQFMEINPGLIEQAKLELSTGEDSLPTEVSTDEVSESTDEDSLSSEVSTDEVSEVVEDDADQCVSKLLDLGIPVGLTDELALEGLCTIEAILEKDATDGLESISGIGPASAEKIRAALQS